MSPVLDIGLNDTSRAPGSGANSKEREFVSGEVVEPGVYVDVESGAVVRVTQADELPEGRIVMRCRRRFKRVA